MCVCVCVCVLCVCVCVCVCLCYSVGHCCCWHPPKTVLLLLFLLLSVFCQFGLCLGMNKVIAHKNPFGRNVLIHFAHGSVRPNRMNKRPSVIYRVSRREETSSDSNEPLNPSTASQSRQELHEGPRTTEPTMGWRDTLVIPFHFVHILQIIQPFRVSRKEKLEL